MMTCPRVRNVTTFIWWHDETLQLRTILLRRRFQIKKYSELSLYLSEPYEPNDS